MAIRHISAATCKMTQMTQMTRYLDLILEPRVVRNLIILSLSLLSKTHPRTGFLTLIRCADLFSFDASLCSLFED